MGLLTLSDYGRCPCGGVYEQQTVEIRKTFGEETVIVTDIPQGKCPECDSRVHKAAMLEGIEAVMRRRPPPPPRLLS